MKNWSIFFNIFISCRASREEMLQRAGDGSLGPRVPDGPPVNTTGDKGFGFTQFS
jgi:hypothetical protein